MSTSMPTDQAAPTARAAADDPLGDPETRRFLVELVRKRVPAADVEDVVQTVLVEALADEERPRERTELRRWLTGIARHKAADVHRRAGREPVAEPVDQETGPAPIEARALAEWAEEQAKSVRDAGETLRWMAREGEGDKLETIAAEENVPAARVRQRVSRMRRWMKQRWLAELALVAAVVVAALVAFFVLRREQPTEALVPEPPSALPPEPTPLERARALRAEAIARCDRADWAGCLEGLDRAAAIDPAGDREPSVVDARERAAAALREPAPAPTSSSPPKSVAPAPKPAPTSLAPLPSDLPKEPPQQQEKAPPRKAAPKPSPKSKAMPSKEGSSFDLGPSGTPSTGAFEGKAGRGTKKRAAASFE